MKMNNTRYSNALKIDLETRFRAISNDCVTNIGPKIEATNTISVNIEFDLDFGVLSNSFNRQIIESQRGRRQRRQPVNKGLSSWVWREPVLHQLAAKQI